MREPGHPCTRRRCRTPVEVMRKAALHGDWHPVPTSLQTRCSPAGPERQSALNSRPLSVLCSTSTLSGPSTPINPVASRLSFVRWLYRLHVLLLCPPVCTCGHEHGHGLYMAPACQHATRRPSPHSRIHVLCTLCPFSLTPSLSSVEASNLPSNRQRAWHHTRRGLLTRPSVLKQKKKKRVHRQQTSTKVRRPATPASHMI